MGQMTSKVLQAENNSAMFAKIIEGYAVAEESEKNLAQDDINMDESDFNEIAQRNSFLLKKNYLSTPQKERLGEFLGVEKCQSKTIDEILEFRQTKHHRKEILQILNMFVNGLIDPLNAALQLDDYCYKPALWHILNKRKYLALIKFVEVFKESSMRDVINQQKLKSELADDYEDDGQKVMTHRHHLQEQTFIHRVSNKTAEQPSYYSSIEDYLDRYPRINDLGLDS